MEHGFESIDYIILIGYLVFILLVGVYFAKKEISGKEYFKGDGSIPWWVTSVSLFATLLSPISFLSLAGIAYAGDWHLWFAQIGLFLAAGMAICYFLPVYRNLNLDTAYEYLELRFNKGLRIVGGAIFIVFQIGRMSIIMYLPAIALAAVTGINTYWIILFMGIIATIYSYMGGIKSVLWTDFIQGVVLIGGGLFALFFLLSSIQGGLPEVVSVGTQNDKFFGTTSIFDLGNMSHSLLIVVFGAGFSTAFSYISSQDMVQRYLTTTDLREMNKMTILNVALSLGTATLFFFIGTALYVFYTQLGDVPGGRSDLVFANYIVNQLPAGISGLLIAGLFAAGQSTLSTGLNSVATSWTLDIQKVLKPGMSDAAATRIAKVVSLIVGAATIMFALKLAHSDISSAYEWFNGLMGLMLGVVGGTFTLGVMTRRATSTGAIFGFVVTLLVAIYISYFTDITIWAYSIINLFCSIIFGYFGSLILPGESKVSNGGLTYYDVKDQPASNRVTQAR